MNSNKWGNLMFNSIANFFKKLLSEDHSGNIQREITQDCCDENQETCYNPTTDCKVEEECGSTSYGIEELKGMTNQTLKDFAKEKGIPTLSKDTKEVLVKKILAGLN